MSRKRVKGSANPNGKPSSLRRGNSRANRELDHLPTTFLLSPITFVYSMLGMALCSTLFLIALPFLLEDIFLESQARAAQAANSQGSHSMSQSMGESITDMYEGETIDSLREILDREEPLHKMKEFHAPTLAYVTPWNGYGYTMARKYSNKFTHVSPVWHQIKDNGSGQYRVFGSQDVDKQWISEVRKGNGFTNTRIVPRFIIEGLNYQPFQQLASGEKELKRFVAEIVKTCRLFDYDGIVLEGWATYSRYIDKNMLRAFVLKVAQRMKAAQLEMILVIPPMRYTSERQMSTFFDRKDFDVLKKEIAFFSIMTYDFSSRPGPNAPINWTRAAIEMLVPENITAERNKILVGLNFYGYDYSPTNTRALVNTEYSAIVHNEALDLACKWSHEYREMEFRYKVHNEIHEMWYPTPNSVRARIDLSRELNVGISIWEIGQGIEPFYDYL